MERRTTWWSVTIVVVFDTDEELIALVKDADVMVKGSDYKANLLSVRHIVMR